MGARGVAAAPDGVGDRVVAAGRATTERCQVVHGLGTVGEAVPSVVDLQPLGRVAAAAPEAVAGERELPELGPLGRGHVLLIGGADRAVRLGPLARIRVGCHGVSRLLGTVRPVQARRCK